MVGTTGGALKQSGAMHPEAALQRLIEQVQAARTGAVSVVQLTRAALDRVAATEADLHAWVVLSQRALADATERDARAERGPLHGAVIGVKDIIDVAGLPTRCGSVTTSPHPVTESAPCVRRLEDLGAVVLGKTVTTEFAYFAPGPTRNPHALDHTPGGSSSGSAAAVAAGVVPLALGSQTAGSLTRPAAYCGAAGMVLAHGATDLSGIVGLSPSLDSFGLLAGTVDDLAYAYAAFTGTDPGAGKVSAALVWRGSGLAEIDPLMSEAVDRAARLLAQSGLPVGELARDELVESSAADHPVVMAYEAVRERPELLDRRDQLSAPLVELLETGLATADADYRAAMARLAQARDEVQALLADGRVIVGPAAPGPAPRGLTATGSPVLSRPWQALGLVAVTVPGARTPGGLPLGLQVVGLPGDEPRVLAAASTLEALLDAVA